MKQRATLFSAAVLMAALLTGIPARAQSLFKDLIPGPHPASSTPDDFMIVGGKMFFVTAVISGGPYNNQLWVSDGTVAGTVLVKDSLAITNIAHPVVLRADANGTLFFTVIDNPGCSSCAPELWKSDGTTAGTTLVTTLDYLAFGGGGTGSAPDKFAALGNKVLFQFGKDNGRELWVSDGTAAGTMEVIDLATGSSSGYPNAGAADAPMISFNGKVYFQGGTSVGKFELYSSDGTAAGTTLVKQINPSAFNGSDPSGWIIYNNELYFYADDGNGGIWKTDGTDVGTVKVYGPSGFSQPTLFKGELYFGSDNYSLWKTNGTTAGTVMIKDLVGNPRGANNDFIFTHYYKTFSTPPYYQDMLWKSDGTAAGTTEVPFDMGMSSSYAVIDNVMYMTRLDSGSFTNVGIWATDGTMAGTSKVLVGYGTGNVFVYNNSLFFTNYETATGYELWSMNPGVSGLQRIASEAEVLVFPNPANGIVNFVIPNHKEAFTVEIYNLSGEKIRSEQIHKELDLSNCPKGVYFAKVYAGDNCFTSKIVLQ